MLFWEWLTNAKSRALYPQEREQLSIAQEAGWAPGTAWTGAENLVLPRFDLPTVHPVASLTYQGDAYYSLQGDDYCNTV